MNINHIRKDYSKYELTKETVNPDPFKQFDQWFQSAVSDGIADVNAMTLATATRDGRPSARIVLLKSFGQDGFVFYSNYTSRKGRELEMNPHAALLIHWKELERQIRVEGHVEKIADDESDKYFASRPYESQISALVSRQSETIPSRRFLEEKWEEYLKETKSRDLQRPSFWGGYRIIPEIIEFWQGRSNRLHDRILYSLAGKRVED